MKFPCICASLLLAATGVIGHVDEENWGWAELVVRLPRAVSDHTAVINPAGVVYIAGGCGK